MRWPSCTCSSIRPASISFIATFASRPYDRLAFLKRDVRLTPDTPDSSAIRSTSPTILTLLRYTSPISKSSRQSVCNKHYVGSDIDRKYRGRLDFTQSCRPPLRLQSLSVRPVL